MAKHYQMDFQEFLDSDTSRYDYAIIDPPWNYDDKPPSIENQLSYSLWDNMKLSDIFDKLSVKYIFLWITSSMLPVMFECLNNTKYVYKTLIPWIKTTTNDTLFYGLGNTFRNCVEYVAVLQTMDAPVLRLQQRNVIIAPTGKRTLKPKFWEESLCQTVSDKGLTGVYIFSGGELEFIDSVDTYTGSEVQKVLLF